jgi:hypothetical protein
MPCRPSKPQHKAKWNAGSLMYVLNTLQGRRFKSLAEENLFLKQWESQVADKRIHGTTRKQVAACFEEERPHLQPLPDSLFPSSRKLAAMFIVTVTWKSLEPFTKFPLSLLATKSGRWDSRCVRVFNERVEQVQIYTRVESGQFSRAFGTGGSHAPVLSSCRYWISPVSVRPSTPSRRTAYARLAAWNSGIFHAATGAKSAGGVDTHELLHYACGESA